MRGAGRCLGGFADLSTITDGHPAASRLIKRNVAEFDAYLLMDSSMEFNLIETRVILLMLKDC
jgi:hypothetical protein